MTALRQFGPMLAVTTVVIAACTVAQPTSTPFASPAGVPSIPPTLPTAAPTAEPTPAVSAGLTRVKSPGAYAVVAGMCSGPGILYLVAFSSTSTTGGQLQVAVYSTADGVIWTTVPVATFPVVSSGTSPGCLPASDAGVPGQMAMVVQTDLGPAAIVGPPFRNVALLPVLNSELPFAYALARHPDPGVGWLVVGSFCESDSGPCPGRIWRSIDLIDWQVAALSGAASWIAALPSGWAIAGCPPGSGEIAVWSSRQGNDWDSPELVPDSQCVLDGFTASPDGKVLVALAFQRVWRSEGGAPWELVADLSTKVPGFAFLTATALKDGFIAVGYLYGDERAVVVTSSDGTDWIVAPDRPVYRGAEIRHLAVFGDLLVGVGDSSDVGVFLGPASIAAYRP